MNSKVGPSRSVIILRVLTLVVFVLAVDYWVYPYGAPMPGRTANIGENGLWLRYTWYFGEHSQADLDALPQELSENQIRYAYFHVRSTHHDGALTYHYPGSAIALTSTLHRTAPDVKLIAWVYAGNSRGMGLVDLSKPDVRRKMVAEARWLVTDCGFDGVQWDYEICQSGDQGLVNLLRETRAALPADKILSACTAIWLPDSGTFGWTDEYFGEVAKNCDQMTVMAYDTAAYFPRAYVDVVRAQVVHISTDVGRANPKCRLLLGIPTYEEGTKSHNPHAENIEMALRGIRLGIADSSTDRGVIAGVAVFADYTTDAREWMEYRRSWLGK